MKTLKNSFSYTASFLVLSLSLIACAEDKQKTDQGASFGLRLQDTLVNETCQLDETLSYELSASGVRAYVRGTMQLQQYQPSQYAQEARAKRIQTQSNEDILNYIAALPADIYSIVYLKTDTSGVNGTLQFAGRSLVEQFIINKTANDEKKISYSLNQGDSKTSLVTVKVDDLFSNTPTNLFRSRTSSGISIPNLFASNTRNLSLNSQGRPFLTQDTQSSLGSEGVNFSLVLHCL